MRALALLLLLPGVARGAQDEDPNRGAQPAATREAAQPSNPESAPQRSKKEQFLVDKSARPAVHAAQPTAAAARAPLSLRNVWTREVLPLDPARPPAQPVLDGFLRDHYTNQASTMDPRLLGVVTRSAARFKANVVEVVSGYRAPKYQLMLRKKGHEVARDSQHPRGHAVDFRLIGSSTHALYRYVRSLRVGGVGYYPHSAFVHADVGRVRTWRGR
jgi:uncharacterized protein YcbK (DUF882 family)